MRAVDRRGLTDEEKRPGDVEAAKVEELIKEVQECKAKMENTMAELKNRPFVRQIDQNTWVQSSTKFTAYELKHPESSEAEQRREMQRFDYFHKGAHAKLGLPSGGYPPDEWFDDLEQLRGDVGRDLGDGVGRKVDETVDTQPPALRSRERRVLLMLNKYGPETPKTARDLADPTDKVGTYSERTITPALQRLIKSP